MICIFDSGEVHKLNMVRLFQFYIPMKHYDPFIIVIDTNDGQLYIGVVPIGVEEDKKLPHTFKIIVNGQIYGEVYYLQDEWVSYDIADEDLVKLIGSCIYKLYEKGNRRIKKLVPEEFSVN